MCLRPFSLYHGMVRDGCDFGISRLHVYSLFSVPQFGSDKQLSAMVIYLKEKKQNTSMYYKFLRPIQISFIVQFTIVYSNIHTAKAYNVLRLRYMHWFCYPGFLLGKISEYDQETPQSQTAEKPVAS